MVASDITSSLAVFIAPLICPRFTRLLVCVMACRERIAHSPNHDIIEYSTPEFACLLGSPMTNIPPQPPIWEHGQRRMTLVQQVLGEVLNGHWKPGQHLVGQELADRYGVSQTPIREALITLAGIGVVDLLPNRGAVVRTVSVQEVREVCQVRRVLECEAARGAASRIDADAVRGLIGELHALATLELGPAAMIIARDIDDRLHDLVSQSCGNTLLAREIGRLKLLFRAYRDSAWERVSAVDDYSRLPKETTEHLLILEALAAHDAATAVKAMSRHIRKGESYWVRIITANRHTLTTKKKGQS
jgi:GntR family transcriptional regulator, rspAB operon transcriptional repressor